MRAVIYARYSHRPAKCIEHRRPGPSLPRAPGARWARAGAGLQRPRGLGCDAHSAGHPAPHAGCDAEAASISSTRRHSIASAATRRTRPAFFKRMTFAEVTIVTLAEGEISELHVGLKGTMNALFLKDLAQKTRRGLQGRVLQGLSGGGVCYGYDLVPGRPAAVASMRARPKVVQADLSRLCRGTEPARDRQKAQPEGHSWSFGQSLARYHDPRPLWPRHGDSEQRTLYRSTRLEPPAPT